MSIHSGYFQAARSIKRRKELMRCSVVLCTNLIYKLLQNGENLGTLPMAYAL